MRERWGLRVNCFAYSGEAGLLEGPERAGGMTVT